MGTILQREISRRSLKKLWEFSRTIFSVMRATHYAGETYLSHSAAKCRELLSVMVDVQLQRRRSVGVGS